MHNIEILIVLLTIPFLLQCSSPTKSEEVDPIFPAFADENRNNINDYVQQPTHRAGLSSLTKANLSTSATPADGRPHHNFTDADNDGICDYAQDGSPTWHGPGFTDNNNNNVCDYWDEVHPLHNRHDGMRFHDENENHVNDYFEEATHMAKGHNFTDADNDGICDYAQDGSSTWHGPGFTDNNNNNICDYWEEGGRGRGEMMNNGAMMGR